MKKTLLLMMIVLMLAGCGHSDEFVKLIEGQSQQPDSTFGTDGATSSLSDTVTVTQIVKDSDGNILLGGCNDTKKLSAVWKYNSFGTLVSSFATNGEFLSDEDNCISAIVLDSKNRIILVDGYKIRRLFSDGSADTSFGINGALDTRTLLEVKSDPLVMAEDYLRLSYIENFAFNKPTFTLDKDDNIYFVAKDEIWQLKNGENKFNRYATGLGFIYKMAVNNANQLVLLDENSNIKLFDIDLSGVLTQSSVNIDASKQSGRLFTISSDDHIFLLSLLSYPILFMVEKWGLDGETDASFGKIGGVVYNQANYFAYTLADLFMIPEIEIDKNGNVYVIAMTIGHKMMAFRYDSKGNLDKNFGDEGVVSYPVDCNFTDNYVYKMDSDGHFYFAKTIDGKMQLWKF